MEHITYATCTTPVGIVGPVEIVGVMSEAGHITEILSGVNEAFEVLV